MQKSMETENKGTEDNVAAGRGAVRMAGRIFQVLLLFFLPGLLVAGGSYYYGIPGQEAIRNMVMLQAGTLNLVFAWFYCEMNGSLDYDNASHPGRFALFFSAGTGLCCLLPYFPHQAWPLLPLAVALSLTGNLFLGLFAYGILTMSAVFLAGSSVTVFFLYFVCGGVAALLFMRPEISRSTGIPMLTALLYFFAAQAVSAVLFDGGPLAAETLVLPGINLFVTALLLFFVLRCCRSFIEKQTKNELVIQQDKDGESSEKAETRCEQKEPADNPGEEQKEEAVIWMEEIDRRQEIACLEEAEAEGGEEQFPTLSDTIQKAARRMTAIRELVVVDGREQERNLSMSFYVENDTEVEFPFSVEEVVEVITKEILTSESCPYETHVNVMLTDNEGIRQYNRDYRDIDRPTDVLSFPNLDFETPSDFSLAEKQRALYFDPETGELMLGDIVISVDKVKEQAQAFGHSEKREFAFLVAHSMLHLCGYDHMEKEEAAVMKCKQIMALTNIGITRDYR